MNSPETAPHPAFEQKGKMAARLRARSWNGQHRAIAGRPAAAHHAASLLATIGAEAR